MTPDLDDFSSEELMKEVEYRFSIGSLRQSDFTFCGLVEDAAPNVIEIPTVFDDGQIVDGLELEPLALDEAAARWRRGERREALHHLELALGRDFSGLGDLQPEHLK